jgi:hypothetical protein
VELESKTELAFAAKDGSSVVESIGNVHCVTSCGYYTTLLIA